MRRRSSIAIHFLIATALSVPLWAQSEIPDSIRPLVPDIEINVFGDSVVARTEFNTVDKVNRLMRMRRFDLAADLLTSLLDKDPRNKTFQQLLNICLEETGSFSRLLLILQNRLQTVTPSFALYRDIGKAHLMLGAADSAAHYFYRAASLQPGDEPALANLVDNYPRMGKYREASELIDSLRVLSGNRSLLAEKKGEALAAQKQFASATEEYLLFMERDSLAAREGERRLISLIHYPESADTVMAILGERMRGDKTARQLRFTYGQLLMEQDKFGQAFTFYKDIDSAQGYAGGELLFFMSECQRRKRHDFVLTAGEHLLMRNPQTPLVGNVRSMLADAYIGMGQPDKALVECQAMLDTQDRPVNKADAHLKMGLIYQMNLRDRVSARRHLQTASMSLPGSIFDVRARMALASLSASERAFDSAQVLYRGLASMSLPDDLAEQVDFSEAQCHLFSGAFDSAAAGFRQVIARYPRGLYVNDAIQFSLILAETMDAAAGQIDLFSSAEFFRFTEQNDSLEFYLTKICRIGVPTLAPISYLRLGELYIKDGRVGDALAAVDTLTARYPESYFAPYGLKFKADVLVRSPKDREAALTIYRDLLSTFGAYPFSAEIREILRRFAEEKHS